MPPLLGVIADDLTGGMETASMLVSLGVDVAFVTRPERVAAKAATAIVVAQKTRVADAEDAVRRSEAAATALLNANARQLFFKYCATFDSTDKGNIGPVADRLLELTGAPQTVFCPSAPELARTVYNGHLFVGTQLVSDSPKRHDPLTPMTDPDLVRVLQRQSRYPVDLLPHRLVQGDGAAMAAHVASAVARGSRHFITDAIYERDLDALAELTVDWKLITGNSPIIQHFPKLWRARGLLAEKPATARLPAVGGHGVVLAGSCAVRTLEQLAAFETQRPVLRIDLCQIGGAERAVALALDWTSRHLDAGPVAIATSDGPDGVSQAQAKYGREGAAGLAETILGTLAVELHERGTKRFVVAGGETSGTIVERLGVEDLTIGRYQGPGISRATSMGDDPMGFCLKSGKLGPVDMFLPTMQQMMIEE